MPHREVDFNSLLNHITEVLTVSIPCYKEGNNMHLQNRIPDILDQLDTDGATGVEINRRDKLVTVTCSMPLTTAHNWELIGATLHIDITDEILPEDGDDFIDAVINGVRIIETKEAA